MYPFCIFIYAVKCPSKMAGVAICVPIFEKTESQDQKRSPGKNVKGFSVNGSCRIITGYTLKSGNAIGKKKCSLLWSLF